MSAPRPESDEPKAAALIVAYGAADALGACLSALGRDVPVMVVDNSSSAEVAVVVERHGGGYVDAGGNRGFSAAVNIGLAQIPDQTADVLLLNPDALVDSRTVHALSRELHSQAHGRLAAAAPCLRGPDGREQRVAWPFPTPLRMWAEALGLGRLPARHTFLAGAVLLISREAIDDIGGFDERFFLYGEEADWQRRARARGWRSRLVPSLDAVHEGAGTSTDTRRREALFHAGQETYIRKWYGSGGWCLYRVGACVGAAARALLLGGERRVRARGRLALYLRGPRRCSAPARD